MQKYKTRVRKMRPERADERATEDPQSWFRDEDIARAKALTEHVRQTGRMPATEQEN